MALDLSGSAGQPVTQASHAEGLLREFNRAGVVSGADVHVAQLLGRLGAVEDERVLLAIALAVRAPRLGHVFVDLAQVAEQVSIDAADDAQASRLPWPTPSEWSASLAGTDRLVADVGRPLADDPVRRPLWLDGTRLYLDRYWRQQERLAQGLLALAAAPPRNDQPELTEAAIRDLNSSADQALALTATLQRGLSVIVGGPGSGKTTTIVRLIALLWSRGRTERSRSPVLGLCAPTGRAAARLAETLHAEVGDLNLDAHSTAALTALRPLTIHQLLRSLPNGGFRHDRENPLPHDVVIVDETSMVSLSLMCALADALRPDAQLVLVGDPDQLTSVEAGAVLGDIVGQTVDAGESPASGAASPPTPHARSPIDGCVVRLHGSHRFGGEIAALADAIRAGEAEAALALLSEGVRPTEPRSQPAATPDSPPTAADQPHPTASAATIRWLRTEPGAALEQATLAPVRELASAAFGAVRAAAQAGDAARALGELDRFRLLCARRTGPFGAERFAALVAGWLTEGDAAEQSSGLTDGLTDVGRPLLIGANDYEAQLMNGDCGVIVAGLGAVFNVGGRLRSFPPARLAAAQTLYAMTIHKSQGSQFGSVVVVLPEPDSPVLTRELLYTAVTRARRRLLLVASEPSLRRAIERPVARASGLGELLRPGAT